MLEKVSFRQGLLGYFVHKLSENLSKISALQ